MADHQGHRSESRGEPPAEVGEWKNEQWNATLETLDSEDQSLWRMTKRLMIFSNASPPCYPRGIRSLKLREGEDLAEILETQFQLVTDPSVPAVI